MRAFKSNLLSKINYKIIVLLILLISTILRFPNLGSIPEGLHADEAAYGYNAYSILKTGKDEYGVSFPLEFKSFGDYKGAIYSYLSIPFIQILGLNELSVRIVSAISGVILVLLTIKIIYLFFNSRVLSLVTGLLVAISPSLITLSRVQSDPLVSIVLLLLGFYNFVHFIKNGNKFNLIYSIIFVLISFYTNTLSRILGLFLFITFPIIKPFGINKRYKYSIIFIIIIFLLSSQIHGNNVRFGQLNSIGGTEITLPLEEKNREDQFVSPYITRLFHNKLQANANFLLSNYFKYFSYEFLFNEAKFPERERVPGIGIFYKIELPFLLVGLYFLLKRRSKVDLFFLIWAFGGPVFLVFANNESPNIHRFLISILPIYFIFASGLYYLLLSLKRSKYYYILLGTLIIIYIFSFLDYIHELYNHQPLNQPFYRGFAYKELVLNLKNFDPLKSKMIFTKSISSPYIYYLFYTKFDPNLYQKMGSPRDLDYSGFNNIIFVPKDCPSNDRKYYKEILDGNDIIFINKGGCKVENHIVINFSINWRNGVEAFQIAKVDIEKLKNADFIKDIK